VLDTALVVDTSGSIQEFQPPGVEAIQLIKSFLEQLVGPPIQARRYYDHFGLVTFESIARTLFDLDDRTSLDALRNGINLLPNPHGETNTPEAINLALQVTLKTVTVGFL